jgi:hypothetical protein
MNPMHEEPSSEQLESLHNQREKEAEKRVYTPRPRWQIVGAWILLIIVVLAVINVCYWQITGIPSFLLD